MGWEIDFIEKHPCPCGKGEYEKTSKSDDFFRNKTEYEMLCQECKPNYFYSTKIMGGQPGSFKEKGWTKK